MLSRVSSRASSIQKAGSVGLNETVLELIRVPSVLVIVVIVAAVELIATNVEDDAVLALTSVLAASLELGPEVAVSGLLDEDSISELLEDELTDVVADSVLLLLLVVGDAIETSDDEVAEGEDVSAMLLKLDAEVADEDSEFDDKSLLLGDDAIIVVEGSVMLLLLLDPDVMEDISDTDDALLLLSVGATMTLLEDEPTEDEEKSVLMLLSEIGGSAGEEESVLMLLSKSEGPDAEEVPELEELLLSATIELDVEEPVKDAVTALELVDDTTAVAVKVAGIVAVPWKQEQALLTLMGAKVLT